MNSSLPKIIRPRIKLDEQVAFGPGKAELLRSIQQQGSISAAARAQGMSYKRAWLLLRELQEALGLPVISSSVGGSGGGGATVTPLGLALLAHYDAIEAACAAAALPHLQGLQGTLQQHDEP